MKQFLLITALIISLTSLYAQDDDLMALLNDPVAKTDFTYATFKSTRIVSGHSVESQSEGVLQFVVSHNFGKINDGAYNLYGLDQSTVRLGFQYGVTPRFTVGVGRSSHLKTFDGFLKYKMLRQSKGAQNMPITISYVTGMDLQSIKWQADDMYDTFENRLSYFHQILIARKFNEAFSFQLTPTLVHRNYIEQDQNHNDVFAVGVGARYKMSKRVSFNVESFLGASRSLPDDYNDMIAIGMDIETGGHVFQLHLSNAQPMFESGFITETKGSFFDGDIYFGFNISRVFTLKKPKEFQEE